MTGGEKSSGRDGVRFPSVRRRFCLVVIGCDFFENRRFVKGFKLVLKEKNCVVTEWIEITC